MKMDLTSLPSNPFNAENLVYVKRLELEEAASIVPPNALDSIEMPDQLFALHSANGERIAIVEGRDAAFAAARANELKPFSVH
ncbi:MAG: DUF1150 family protein [Hyphomonadaceae bacterium]